MHSVLLAQLVFTVQCNDNHDHGPGVGSPGFSCVSTNDHHATSHDDSVALNLSVFSVKWGYSHCGVALCLKGSNETGF